MPPKVLGGTFNFRITRPPTPVTPAVGVLGTFSIFPDAELKINFDGSVSLPPGTWEVGIIQNVWNDRVTIEYSNGGEIYISLDNFPPLLDQLPGQSDIWLNTFGTGVTTFSNSTSRDKTFQLSLEAGDTPTSPPIPGIQTRCGGTIQEQLVWAERVLQLVAVLAARKDGQLFSLAATSGDTYGYMWRLEPPPSSNPFRFRPLFNTGIERVEPFSLLPSGVNTTRPNANEVFAPLVIQAEASYLGDCGVRPPRDGDLHLWP